MNEESAPPPQEETPTRRRAIRSFVLRQGRQTEAQKRAFVDHWPRFGLDYRGERRAYDATFGRTNPLVMEIGFGNGEQLLFAAHNEPGKDFLGIEVHGPGVGRLLNGLAEIDARNVRIYQHDAVEVLRHEVKDGALAEARIYFPDPWHKKRHHKRRIVQPPFAASVARVLAPGGVFRLATDWQPYAEQMLEVLGASPCFENLAPDGGYAPRDPERAATRFERRGERLGHGVWDLSFRRNP